MFIGHFGVGLAAKRVAPAVSLGTFFLAAQLADLIWPVLVLTGVEVVEIDPGATAVTPLDFVHYPYSHSLVAMGLLGALLAGAHFLARRPRPRDSAILGALVVSHWLLDFIVHRPDLPLTLRDERHFGLGLWQSTAATLAVELPLFLAGLALYARADLPPMRFGRRFRGTGRWARYRPAQ